MKQDINILGLRRDLRFTDHVSLYLAQLQKTPLQLMYCFEPLLIAYCNSDVIFQYRKTDDVKIEGELTLKKHVSNPKSHLTKK